jgi:hypothetical protein
MSLFLNLVLMSKQNWRMTMTNSQKAFQNLDAISALNVLEDEVAATCSGGLTLFADANRQGQRFDTNAPKLNNLGYFNDLTSSIQVPRGQRWAFYEGANFNGRRVELGEGVYNVTEANIRNDTISSLERVS